MNITDKFLRYVAYDTQADASSNTIPSTMKQKELSKVLVEDLKKVGIKDAFMDEYGYVYGEIKGDDAYYTIGLIAHIDTALEVTDFNVQARVINNYDGNDIKLNDSVTTTVSRFPFLTKLKGSDLVVTDGTTLLGGDDKAGIAIIMQAVQDILNSDIKHGNIKICFTTDEEIGRGTIKFNYDYFKVDFAYTLDGGEYNKINYECFNAASVDVNIKGLAVHPGTAKNKMINANQIAFEFHGLLDQDMVPEKTAKYEGFNMLYETKTAVENATMHYLIRNHDFEQFEKQKQDFINIKDSLNNKYQKEIVSLEISDLYYNMYQAIKEDMTCVEVARKAMANLGYEMIVEPIRGGTDGSALSFGGVKCPNLGTGAYNCHGVHELWDVNQGLKLVEIIKEIVQTKRN